jgi:hypothetical protein
MTASLTDVREGLPVPDQLQGDVIRPAYLVAARDSGHFQQGSIYAA